MVEIVFSCSGLLEPFVEGLEADDVGLALA